MLSGHHVRVRRWSAFATIFPYLLLDVRNGRIPVWIGGVTAAWNILWSWLYTKTLISLEQGVIFGRVWVVTEDLKWLIWLTVPHCTFQWIKTHLLRNIYKACQVLTSSCQVVSKHQNGQTVMIPKVPYGCRCVTKHLQRERLHSHIAPFQLVSRPVVSFWLWLRLSVLGQQCL